MKLGRTCGRRRSANRQSAIADRQSPFGTPHSALRTPQFKARGGFSLMELLTVISIIGLLLAIGVGASGIAGRKMREARLRAELHAYTTAIESYKAVFGHYPPDNHRIVRDRNGTNDLNVNPAVNQLYYELVGTIATNQGKLYRTADRQTWIDSETFQETFNVPGIVNSVQWPTTRPQSFLPSVKAEQRKQAKLSRKADAVEILVAPVDWPAKWPNNPAFSPPFDKDAKLKRVNPWRYVSTHPTNNPGGFDLWAEYMAGSQWRVIGNWKE